MKETRVSAFNVEITSPYDQGTGKPVKVVNYNLEILIDIPWPGMKPLRVSNYTLEVVQSYVEEDITLDNPPYYFTGQVLDDVGPIEREVISYNRTTYKHMDTSFSDAGGSFFLDSTTSGICFLVALDDDGGTDYNHLVAAIVKPAVFDDYGFSELNPGKSALDIKNYNKAAIFNGLYWIQPTGYISPIQVYCDMTTQGGGWMMCARWDRDFPGNWEVCLPPEALRVNTNLLDLQFTNIEGTYQAASLDTRSIISAGASKFMHVSMDIDDKYWKYIYFSDIYKVVRDNPDNIFNVAFDTNDAEAVVGISMNKSAEENTLWYDYDMSILTSVNLGGVSYNYCLVGGEGDGHFSIGSRTGATYASHPSSTTSTTEDHVTWGFYGKDGTVPSTFTFSYPPRVGTAKSAGYLPSCRFNFMFIR